MSCGRFFLLSFLVGLLSSSLSAQVGRLSVELLELKAKGERIKWVWREESTEPMPGTLAIPFVAWKKKDQRYGPVTGQIELRPSSTRAYEWLKSLYEAKKKLGNLVNESHQFVGADELSVEEALRLASTDFESLSFTANETEQEISVIQIWSAVT